MSPLAAGRPSCAHPRGPRGSAAPSPLQPRAARRGRAFALGGSRPLRPGPAESFFSSACNETFLSSLPHSRALSLSPLPPPHSNPDIGEGGGEMHDLPEPNRAQRGVREPSEPEQLLSASLRGLLRTRKTRTGLGPRRRRRAHARPACLALPRPAWRGGPGPGERSGQDRLPALGARSCSVPSCLRSPCQPADLCLFSRLKGALRKVENESDEQTKEGEGAGKQSCLLDLRGSE